MLVLQSLYAQLLNGRQKIFYCLCGSTFSKREIKPLIVWFLLDRLHQKWWCLTVMIQKQLGQLKCKLQWGKHYVFYWIFLPIERIFKFMLCSVYLPYLPYPTGINKHSLCTVIDNYTHLCEILGPVAFFHVTRSQLVIVVWQYKVTFGALTLLDCRKHFGGSLCLLQYAVCGGKSWWG